MEKQTKASLTGTDGPVAGIIKHVTHGAYKNAYRFDAIDGTIQLVIALDDTGNWHRIDGTEPYLSGWVAEMTEQIVRLHE